MAGNYGANQYKNMAVKTASPGQVLIMLYEGAIKNLRCAIAAIEKKDTALKGRHIGKAHDIINELGTSLNFEVGGDIAKNLEQLYNFMGTQLIQANLHNDAEKIHSVVKLLETLLEGWKGAVQQVQKGATK